MTSWRSNPEGADLDLASRPLVVPGERLAPGIGAEQRCLPARRATPASEHPAGHRLVAGWPPLLLEREAVPHVHQRFLVHGLVLQDAEGRFGAVEEEMARLIDVALLERVDHLAIDLGRKMTDHFACAATDGVQRCSPLPADCDSCRSIPRAKSVSSRGSMLGRPRPRLTRVLKLNAGRWPSCNYRVPQADRPAVDRIFGQHVKDGGGYGPISSVPVDEHLTVEMDTVWSGRFRRVSASWRPKHAEWIFAHISKEASQ